MTHKVTLIVLCHCLLLVTSLPLSDRSTPDDNIAHSLNVDYEDEESHPKDVFTQILESNKGSTMRLYHGDIAMDQQRSATKCSGCLWPKSADGMVTVPYSVSPDYTDKEKRFIQMALQDFTTLTCIKLVERTTENDFLNISSGSGCWSYVGKFGGSQFLSVMKDACFSRGVIQHEIQHALGFYHEQSRSDRDDHVDIMWQYINEGDWGNFDKFDTDNLGVPYDYSSVMHYGRYAYSNTSGEQTINPKPDASVSIGQRYGLSQIDIYKVKKLYDCNLCSFLLTGVNGSLGSKSYSSEYSSSKSCIWLIRVNKNKAYLQFDIFDIPPSDDCSSHYITVYNGASRASPVLLEKACGNRDIPLLVASGNSMLVELVHGMSFARADFKASYSSVPCGGTFNTDNGTITSPGYPDLYPNFVDCVTTIWAPLGYQIVLNFTTFELEYSNGCLYDYLIINDGSRANSPELGRYCSDDNIPTLISTGNVMLIMFHSDSWFNKPGYKAYYYFVESP